MKKDEFQKTMSMLAAFYPSVEVFVEMLKAYWLKFRDMDGLQFANACNQAVEVCEYFPTVAKLMELMNNNITLDEVKFELRSIMRVPVGKSFTKKSFHPVTAQILDALGGKMSISQMTDNQFDYKIKHEYKYAIDGIKNDKPSLSRFSNGSQLISKILPEYDKKTKEMII